VRRQSIIARMGGDRFAVPCALSGCLGLIVLSGCAVKTPSNDRAWALEHAVMPMTRFDGDTAKIHNVRNFRHIDEKTMNVAYYDMDLDLADVATVDLFKHTATSVSGKPSMRLLQSMA